MHPEHVQQLVASMNESATRFTRHDVIRDLDQVLREVVTAAVATISDVKHAGITALDARGRLTSTAPSDEVVARLDQAQTALREGPCVAALTEHPHADDSARPAGPVGPRGDGVAARSYRAGEVTGAVVRVDDMAAETHRGGRWPRFGPEALRNGIVSMLSLPLSGDRSPIRALNLYAERPAVFDTATCVTAALFADQAAVALYGAEHVAQLDEAVATRDIIGQAKGILIERHHLAGGEQAFTMLVEASQHANIKLRDVAEWLVTETTARTHGAGGSEGCDEDFRSRPEADGDHLHPGRGQH